MYRFNAEDPGQSLYTPTTVGVITVCYNYLKKYSSHSQQLLTLCIDVDGQHHNVPLFVVD